MTSRFTHLLRPTVPTGSRFTRAKAAALPPITIDRPKGFKKTFQTQQGPLETEYPLDYGYFQDTVNPQDGEGADVFVGTGSRYGRFMKGNDLSGSWQPDEHKWYKGLTDDEHASLMGWWAKQNPQLIRDDTPFADEAAFGQDISRFSAPLAKHKQAALLSDVQLRPHQQRAGESAEEHEEERKLFYHTLGSGKSLTSLSAAEAAGEPYTAIAPASPVPPSSRISPGSRAG